MPDYQNSKIYKLVNDELPDLIYYGSTTQPLYKRLHQHKNKKYGNVKYLFETGNVKIILCENFPCNCKEELIKKEREYIEKNNCINKNIPTRTQKEYNEYNKEKIIKYKKEYYENNKKKIKEKRKEKIICECGSILLKHHKSQHNKTKKHLQFLEDKQNDLNKSSNLSLGII